MSIVEKYCSEVVVVVGGASGVGPSPGAGSRRAASRVRRPLAARRAVPACLSARKTNIIAT